MQLKSMVRSANDYDKQRNFQLSHHCHCMRIECTCFGRKAGAASEEQLATTEEITAASEALAYMAEGLQHLLFNTLNCNYI